MREAEWANVTVTKSATRHKLVTQIRPGGDFGLHRRKNRQSTPIQSFRRDFATRWRLCNRSVMRNPFRLPALALACAVFLAALLPPAPLKAQDDELSRLYPPAYVAVIQQAIRSFLSRDFDTSLKKLDEADR